jgi:excisionase family DNA binding protein
MSDRLISQKEAAAILGVSLKTMQRLRGERRLEFYRLGHRTVKIPLSAIEKFKAEAHYEAK